VTGIPCELATLVWMRPAHSENEVLLAGYCARPAAAAPSEGEEASGAEAPAAEATTEGSQVVAIVIDRAPSEDGLVAACMAHWDCCVLGANDFNNN